MLSPSDLLCKAAVLKMWSWDLGVPETFLEHSQGQIYFHNNTKMLLSTLILS